MKVYLTLIGVVVTTNFSAQSLFAKVEFVEGIVISKFLYHEFGFYCARETQILYNSDTVLFHEESSFNLDLLKQHPIIKESLGNIADYDYKYMVNYFHKIYKKNLTFSDYCLRVHESGVPLVKSLSFYYKRGSYDLYAAYQFKGLIVSYTSNTGIKYGTELDEGEHDCLCPPRSTYVWKNFAVLKEAIELKPLTDKQIKENSFIKSGVRVIEVFYDH